MLDADEAEVVQTLIHERVHVFQRRHPDEAAAVILGDWRMVASPKTAFCAHLGVSERVRSNPDLDAHVYALGGVACLSVFPDADAARAGGLAAAATVRSPSTDSDSVLLGYEHPNEAMAYLLAEAVMHANAHANASLVRRLFTS
jgi:hypothetical protein